MTALLVACLLAGVPAQDCRAEVAGCKARTCELPLPPSWATPGWVNFAAGIVAGEAANVPQAYSVIACTLVRDVERGWHPWGLHRRWFGRSVPSTKHKEAVVSALQGNCDDVPHYIYVGNFADAQLWRRIGYIRTEKVDLYLGPTGQAVVGVPFEEEK